MIGAKSTTLYLWNSSESVPVGLYRLRPICKLVVTELVAVRTPEPLATFLRERGYLPRGIPTRCGRRIFIFAPGMRHSPSVRLNSVHSACRLSIWYRSVTQ